MNYTLHLPNDYQLHPLPGLDEWCADLRANPDMQYRQILGWPEGPNCGLGRYSRLQGRLTTYNRDGDSTGTSEDELSQDNPVVPFMGRIGIFPEGVQVQIGNLNLLNLGQCNDAGLTFPQLATIIENVWFNSGPILK